MSVIVYNVKGVISLASNKIRNSECLYQPYEGTMYFRPVNHLVCLGEKKHSKYFVEKVG